MGMANPRSASDVALAKITPATCPSVVSSGPPEFPGLDVAGQPVDVLGRRVVAVDVGHQHRGDVLDRGGLGFERAAVGVAGEGSLAAAGKVGAQGQRFGGRPSTASTARSCRLSK